MEGRICVDSSAAIGVANRRGNGRLRHVRVGMLWLQTQEIVENGEIGMEKIQGDNNPADLLTKNVDAAKRVKFTGMCSQRYRQGRAEKSLKLAR